MAKKTPAMKRNIDLINKNGGTVMREKRSDGSGDRFFMTNGKAIQQRVVFKLVAAKILTPNNDGLFAGESQTYRLVEGADVKKP